jgi:hypothetical protein
MSCVLAAHIVAENKSLRFTINFLTTLSLSLSLSRGVGKHAQWLSYIFFPQNDESTWEVNRDFSQYFTVLSINAIKLSHALASAMNSVYNSIKNDPKSHSTCHRHLLKVMSPLMISVKLPRCQNILKTQLSKLIHKSIAI